MLGCERTALLSAKLAVGYRPKPGHSVSPWLGVATLGPVSQRHVGYDLRWRSISAFHRLGLHPLASRPPAHSGFHQSYSHFPHRILIITLRLPRRKGTFAHRCADTSEIALKPPP